MNFFFFFFLMIRRPPRSTHCISSAASDVYKRQVNNGSIIEPRIIQDLSYTGSFSRIQFQDSLNKQFSLSTYMSSIPVSYTHLRAHETRHDLVCRLLLEKKKKILQNNLPTALTKM
eukprot:TRINITY_DN4704_c0_g1_i3.p1 TRINITY_DN4704_c0_g1~~TRINITY_DN4704_c0_g1_i3.p1  ORF type:complete len:116 (+),score=36.34 TRINITY_DN4704_c0_g1_i3:71-418(+)